MRILNSGRNVLPGKQVLGALEGPIRANQLEHLSEFGAEIKKEEKMLSALKSNGNTSGRRGARKRRKK